jgi:hypothetical protein
MSVSDFCCPNTRSGAHTNFGNSRPPPRTVTIADRLRFRIGQTSETTNRDLGRRAFAAWNTGDREASAACHADDVVLHGNEDVEGRDAVVAAQWGFFDAFPDTELVLEDVVAADDRWRCATPPRGPTRDR